MALIAASAPLLAACSDTHASGAAAPAVETAQVGTPARAPAAPTDHGAALALRGVAITAGSSAAPVDVPVFDCEPVRSDERARADQYPVPRPPFSKDIFPCTRCHDKPDDHNSNLRNLTLQHLNIKLIHGPREQWCYDCHNPSDRDKLRLAGGRLVSFEKSYELCGQCHGEKLRDWRLGIHGRRIGCWNGKRQYLLCVHCHNPHAPRFQPVKPMPRPKTPAEIQLAGSER